MNLALKKAKKHVFEQKGEIYFNLAHDFENKVKRESDCHQLL
jgi:hypothetical protein